MQTFNKNMAGDLAKDATSDDLYKSIAGVEAATAHLPQQMRYRLLEACASARIAVATGRPAAIRKAHDVVQQLAAEASIDAHFRNLIAGRRR